MHFPGVHFPGGAPKSAGTNFCANGSNPRNTGVVGELVTPRMPTTPSDQGLLRFSQKWIFPVGVRVHSQPETAEASGARRAGRAQRSFLLRQGGVQTHDEDEINQPGGGVCAKKDRT